MVTEKVFLFIHHVVIDSEQNCESPLQFGGITLW